LNRTVIFDLETTARYDQFPYYDQGSYLKPTRRLKDVSIFHENTLVRRYHFNYTIGEATNRSLLQSIQEYGTDNTTALPATVFTYSEVRKNWVENTSWDPPVLFKHTDGLGLQNDNARLMDFNRDGLIDIIRGNDEGHEVFINNGLDWEEDAGCTVPVNIDMSIMVGDVNKDGLPDLVRSYYQSDDVYSNKTIYIHNGTCWEVDASWTTPDHFEICDNNGCIDNGIRLMDVNNDGLVDMVKATDKDHSADKKIWINNGTGWELDTSWTPPGYFINFAKEDTGLRTGDANGDGLVDFIWGGSDANTERKIYINNGSGWYEDTSWAKPPAAFVFYDLGCSPCGNGLTLGEFNGDGLIDMMRVFKGEDRQAWINNGSGWVEDDMWAVEYLNESVSFEFGDVNGDGAADIIESFAVYQQGGVEGVYINNLTRVDLLTEIQTAYGGRINLTYTPSTTFNNTGSDNISDLGVSFLLIDDVIEDNGMSGAHNTIGTTSHYYANGSYDYTEGEFRGFGYVKETSPVDIITHHYYHQTEELKGKEYETRIEDNSGNIYAKTENDWSSTTTDGIHTVTLDRVDEHAYDTTATPKTRATEYDYDSYGNVNRTSNLGDTSTSGDEITTINEYTVNETAWIVGTVNHTTLYDENSAVVSESWIAYDNRGYGAVPVRGDLTQQEDYLDTGANPISYKSYDDLGNVVNETDPLGRVTEYVYGLNDSTNTFMEQSTNALSQIMNYSYDLGTGNLLYSVDANGYTTSNVYDVHGRISKEIQPYDDNTYPTRQYTYTLDASAPEQIQVSARENAGAAGVLDTYHFYDGFGRSVQTKTEFEDGDQIIYNAFYDDAGRKHAESVPYTDTSSSSYSTPDLTVRNITYVYDVLNRRTQTINTDETTISVAYTPWTAVVTDENGHDKSLERDAHNRIIQVLEYNKGATYTTDYKYSARGELVNITDNQGNVFKFTYDTLGRKTGLDDPDLGVWSYSYDLSGNLVNQTDANSNFIQFEYDNLNRLSKKDFNSDTDVVMAYDISVVGTLSEANSTAGSIDYTHDQRLRITQESWDRSGTTWSIVIAYDSMDRIVNKTFSNGEFLEYNFNSMGTLDSITDYVSNIDYTALGKISNRTYANSQVSKLDYYADDFRLKTVVTGALQSLAYKYDSKGNIIQMNESVDGKYQSYSYDDLDRLITAQENSGFDYEYGYNSIGNLISWDNATHVYSYSYGEDAGAHALTNVTYNVAQITATCTGDAPPRDYGNWVITTDSACSNGDVKLPVGSNINVNSNTQLALDNVVVVPSDKEEKTVYLNLEGNIEIDDSANDGYISFNDAGEVFNASVQQSIAYDSNGNMIDDGTYTFEYNDDSRLYRILESSVLKEQYEYDSEGNRKVKITVVSASVNKTTYYISQEWIRDEYNDGASNNTFYVYGNDEQLSKKDHVGTVTYYHPDHLGSTVVISNAGGTLEERISYMPYGLPRSYSEELFQFTNQEYSSDLGIYDYGARQYNPTIMRFIQADIIIQDVYDPQMLNRYSYVRNNPFIYTDPSGNSLQIIWLATRIKTGLSYIGGEIATLYELSKNPDKLDECKDINKNARSGTSQAGKGAPGLDAVKIMPSIVCIACTKAEEVVQNMLDEALTEAEATEIIYIIPDSQDTDETESSETGSEPPSQDDTNNMGDDSLPSRTSTLKTTSRTIN